MTSDEDELDPSLIDKLLALKDEYCTGTRDRSTREKISWEKLQSLNHVRPTGSKVRRLLDEIFTPDVFTAAPTRRNRSSSRVTTPPRSALTR